MPVTVISGRDLEELRRVIGLPRLIYAGSHGFDIQGPDLRLELAEALDVQDDLDAAAAALEQRLADIAGVGIERKRFAVAVDGRQAADTERERISDVVDEIAAGHPRLRRGGGPRRLELRPDIDWDKGHAVRWLLAELGRDAAGTLPVYIGDDETDEDAFREIRRDGLGILVAPSPRPSAAHHRIGDSDQVTALLEALAALT
jgi:trehalose-phosphatase